MSKQTVVTMTVTFEFTLTDDEVKQVKALRRRREEVPTDLYVEALADNIANNGLDYEVVTITTEEK